MKNLGIELKGSDCILVVLEYSNSNFNIINTSPKIPIDNSDNQDEIKEFFSNISSFVKENNIDNIYIRKRNKKGQYAGGATGFKLEALIQLLENNVKLISPTSVAYTIKKIDIKNLEKQVNQYQIEALKVAITGTLKK